MHPPHRVGVVGLDKTPPSLLSFVSCYSGLSGGTRLSALFTLFETDYHYVAQVGLELVIFLLPWPPQQWESTVCAAASAHVLGGVFVINCCFIHKLQIPWEVDLLRTFLTVTQRSVVTSAVPAYSSLFSHLQPGLSLSWQKNILFLE